MALKLSILIATFSRDIEKIKDLQKSLNAQMMDGIEVIINSEEKTIIGKKRNDLLKQATGDYVVFIDSDDHISANYIWSIKQACSIGNDCIGISGTITTNGKNPRQWHISKEYKTWHQVNGIYYRTPNHISPVKRVLALKAGFPEIAFGEDAEYSRRLLPLLKTETIIKGNLYHYDYYTQKSNS